MANPSVVNNAINTINTTNGQDDRGCFISTIGAIISVVSAFCVLDDQLEEGALIAVYVGLAMCLCGSPLSFLCGFLEGKKFSQRDASEAACDPAQNRQPSTSKSSSVATRAAQAAQADEADVKLGLIEEGGVPSSLGSGS